MIEKKKIKKEKKIDKIKSVMNKLSGKLKKYRETFHGLLGDKRKLERNGIFTAVKVNPLEMTRKRSRVSVVSGGRRKNSRRKNSRRKNSRRKNSRRKRK